MRRAEGSVGTVDYSLRFFDGHGSYVFFGFDAGHSTREYVTINEYARVVYVY